MRVKRALGGLAAAVGLTFSLMAATPVAAEKRKVNFHADENVVEQVTARVGQENYIGMLAKYVIDVDPAVGCIFAARATEEYAFSYLGETPLRPTKFLAVNGTGYGIERDGERFVASANHVVGNDSGKLIWSEIWIGDTETDLATKLELYSTSTDQDVALTKTVDSSEEFPTIKVDTLASLHPGDVVFTTGCSREHGRRVSMGLVREIRFHTNTVPSVAISTDVEVNHGNSGGPGVVARITDDGATLSLAGTAVLRWSKTESDYHGVFSPASRLDELIDAGRNIPSTRWNLDADVTTETLEDIERMNPKEVCDSLGFSHSIEARDDGLYTLVMDPINGFLSSDYSFRIYFDLDDGKPDVLKITRVKDKGPETRISLKEARSAYPELSTRELRSHLSRFAHVYMNHLVHKERCNQTQRVTPFQEIALEFSGDSSLSCESWVNQEDGLLYGDVCALFGTLYGDDLHSSGFFSPDKIRGAASQLPSN